jgi:di/tricarboxylate transporter
MPLSFGTILGGMTTLIGTPPNLIVSGFRRETGVGGFGMFDFAPVGLAVAGVGVVFLVLVGRRIVPDRRGAGAADFDTGTYLTEVRVSGEGRAAGRTLRQVEEMLQKADAQIVSLVRDELTITAPNPRRKLRKGDILVIEAEPESLASALSSLRLGLEEDVPAGASEDEVAGDESGPSEPEATVDAEPVRAGGSDEILLQELVPMPTSGVIGRSATDLELRTRFSLNLLAISRRGRRTIRRLRSARFQAGDVLLMQGSPEALAAFAGEVGCVPLARRAIRIPNRTRAILASVVMAAAIGLTAFGLLPAAVSFAVAVLVFTLLRVVPPRRVYESIDWSVIVLLGALIPVAGAMASTGAADLIARLLLDGVARGQPVVSLALVLVVAMTLSDFMNNAATAAVLCPIAISTAGQLGAAADPFLMAVAIGASCAFLTPIGHQNNTLILGPGGFRFGDYWRLGLPMELIVVAVGVPLLLLVWPL